MSVCQILITGERISVHKKLKVFVAAQVELRVLVDRSCISAREVFDGKRKRLLIVFKHLFLSRFQTATNAWRKHVVDRRFLVVFFKVYGTHHHLSRLSAETSGVEWLFVVAPFSAHQIERCQTQHGGLVEARHKHTHKANGREVADVAKPSFVLFNGDAEEVPFCFGCLAVSCFSVDGATVYDVVLSHLHRFWSNLHAILIELLIFVEGIVLIDILHIWSRFVGRGVAFGRGFRSHRVTIGVVDKFVAV